MIPVFRFTENVLYLHACHYTDYWKVKGADVARLAMRLPLCLNPHRQISSLNDDWAAKTNAMMSIIGSTNYKMLALK